MKSIFLFCALALASVNAMAWSFTSESSAVLKSGATTWYADRNLVEADRAQRVNAPVYIWVEHSFDTLNSVDISFGRITTMSQRYQLTADELAYSAPGFSIYGPTDKFWNHSKYGKWNLKINNSDVEIGSWGVSTTFPVVKTPDSAGGVVSLVAAFFGLIAWRRIA